MKKCFTKLFNGVFILLLSSTSFGFLEAQVERMVIVEEFTNASCVPCAAQNPAFNQLLQGNENRVISIKYQTNWPGFDPYNQQNPSEVNTRVQHYMVQGVPHAAIDGNNPTPSYAGGVGGWGPDDWYNGAPGGYNNLVFDYAVGQETFLEVDLSAEWNEDLTSAQVTVNLINHHDSLPISGSHHLQLALIEKENQWPFPPGSTNEAEFFNIMRKMYPDANGTQVGEIAASDTLQFTFETVVPDYIYNLNQMAFVAFVENRAERYVLNSSISEVSTVPVFFPDVSIIRKSTTASDELCDRTIEMGMEVENSGTEPIFSFDAVFNLGNESVVIEINDTLQSQESIEISVPEMPLIPGNNVVSYRVENINANENRVVNRLSLAVPNDQFSAVGPGVATELDFKFEGDVLGSSAPIGTITESPNNRMILVVNQNGFQNATQPLGGYGESENSLWVNFYQWEVPALPNRGSIILADHIITESVSSVNVIFDRANCQYSGFPTSDALEGHVSFDCGDSWTKVYEKIGTDLATAPPSEPMFLAQPNQWVTDTIRVEGIDAPEMLFKFEVVSDWGNSLFIDNIRLEEVTTNTQTPESFSASISVFPNPTSDLVNIHFNLERESTMLVEIFSAEGKLVDVLHRPNRYLQSGTHQLQWTPLHSGQYFVKFFDGQSQKVESFSVVK
nr:Omp28-related outer membrane protein [Saprospiraceae bacterium]